MWNAYNKYEVYTERINIKASTNAKSPYFFAITQQVRSVNSIYLADMISPSKVGLKNDSTTTWIFSLIFLCQNN